ncbi:MAG: hypothetical protein JXR48_03650 [Candidatus Delongbacteria bacterium]|nr:hypothetical protein [Candidatus Delongbacteria bacterium]MBN2834041.1 hypothetical protein [Candidatus Delongbacteria bacterium]
MENRNSVLIPWFILENYSINNIAGDFYSSVLFLDISGFSTITSMFTMESERGAEKVSEFLTLVFSPVIEIIQRYSGIIISFAGDSILVIFPGTHTRNLSQLQALKAAIEVQKYFKTNSSVRINDREIDFKTKIGLDCSQIYWKISGSKDKKSYLVYGDGVIGAAECERKSNPDEIICTSNFYNKVEIYVNRFTKNEELYRIENCDNYSLRIFSKPDVGSEYGLSLIEFYGKGEMEHIEQYREVSVISILMKSVDDFDIYMPEIFKLVEKYELSHPRIDYSDKGLNILIYANAPLSHFDHHIRALNFALDLKKIDEVKHLKTVLTSGEVYSGFIGSNERKDFACHGKAVNLAARILPLINFGEIACSGAFEKLQIAETDFHSENMFKGFDNSRNVFLIRSLAKSINRDYFSIKFVERKVTTDLIIEKIVNIFQSSSNIFFIADGLNGVGKSRLIRELKNKLHEKISIDHQFTVELVTYKNQIDTFVKSMGMKFYSENIDELYKKFLVSMTRRFKSKTIIILIDNLHIASDDLKKFLNDFIFDNNNINLIFLSSSRLDENRNVYSYKFNIPVIREQLVPFNELETSKFIHYYCLKQTKNLYVRDSNLENVFSATSGIPAMLEIFMDNLNEENRLELIQDDSLGLKINSKEQNFILSRFDKLDKKEKNIVKIASVLGSQFDKKVLSEIENDPITLKKLEDKRILIEKGDYVKFNFAILRETVYHSLTEKEKKRVHGEVFTALLKTGCEDVKMLAIQSMGAGEIDEALKYIHLNFILRILKLISDAIFFSNFFFKYKKIKTIQDYEEYRLVMNQMAKFYKVDKQYPKALEIYEQLSKIDEKHSEANLINTKLEIGSYYLKINDFSKCKGVLDEVENNFNIQDCKEQKKSFFLFKAQFFFYKNDLLSSRNVIEKKLFPILETDNPDDKDFFYYSYQFLGIFAYEFDKNIEESELFFKRSVAFSRTDLMKNRAYDNLSMLYSRTNNLFDSLNITYNQIEILEKLKSYDVYNSYLSIIVLLIKLGKHDQALVYLNEKFDSYRYLPENIEFDFLMNKLILNYLNKIDFNDEIENIKSRLKSSTKIPELENIVVFTSHLLYIESYEHFNEETTKLFEPYIDLDKVDLFFINFIIAIHKYLKNGSFDDSLDLDFLFTDLAKYHVSRFYNIIGLSKFSKRFGLIDIYNKLSLNSKKLLDEKYELVAPFFRNEIIKHCLNGNYELK